MVTTVIKQIGNGRDFPDLVAFAASLPLDLTTVDELHIAELWSDTSDPGGVVIDTICDASRLVVIRAAPGQGVGDLLDPDAHPLRPTPGKGAMIHATSGDAIRLAGGQTRVHVQRLQIVADSGSALIDDGASSFSDVRGCLFDTNGPAPAVCTRGFGATIRDCVVIQRGVGDGIQLSSGARAHGCTVFKPTKPVADGIGVSTSGVPEPEAKSVAVFGFRRSFGDGLANAAALASDQVNELPAPTTFSHPYWTVISALVDRNDTIPGPYNVPLERVSSNLNAFARFDGAPFLSLTAGQQVAFSAIVAGPTSLTSAILLDSSAGRPELRVTWTQTPPGIGLLGQTANLRAVSGTVEDLGGDTYRLTLVAENTTAGALDVSPTFYVTRGIENVGLNVGMYAGAMMAGVGHLGAGFIESNAVPGAGALVGVDPERALVSTNTSALDLRPAVAGPLDDAGVSEGTDLHLRHRLAPDTIGAVSLNTAPQFVPAGLDIPLFLEEAQLVDPSSILTSQNSRTVLPMSSPRNVNPLKQVRTVTPPVRDMTATGQN